jgi:hypothetical protein
MSDAKQYKEMAETYARDKQYKEMAETYDREVSNLRGEIGRLKGENSRLLLALKCCLADLEGVLPQHEPGEDRKHPGWLSMFEAREAVALADGIDPCELHRQYAEYLDRQRKEGE